MSLTVTTDRTAYRPGDEVAVRARARNHTDEPIAGRLELAANCDLATRLDPLDSPISVPAHGEAARTARWRTLEDELWGCDVSATLVVAGHPRIADRRVFVVSDNLVRAAANMAYVSPAYFKQGQRDPIEYAFDKWEQYGIPIVHVYCWAPSNWGTVYPTEDTWLCGQMQYRVSSDDLHLMVRHAKQRGILAVSYARITLEGPEGYRWALANPDKVWYRRPDGVPDPFPESNLAAWDRAAAEAGDPGARLRAWSMVPRLRDNAVLDDGVAQYIRAVRRFGFDCIRWDWHPGYYYDPHTNWLLQATSGGAVHARYYDRQGHLDVVDDPDAEHVRILRRWKSQMRAALPGIVFGYNLQIANAVYPDDPEISPQPSRAYAEMIPGTLIIDEKHFVNESGNAPAGMHRDWTRSRTFWLKGSEIVRRYGGYYYTGGHPNIGAEAFIQHAYSLTYACGGRCTEAAAPSVRHPDWYEQLVAFAQRYAMYFLHPSTFALSPDGPLGERVAVEASRPVVWKPLARTVTDRGRFTLLVHLWNQPVREEMDVMNCEPPAIVENARVRFRQPLDLPRDRARGYVLSYEWPTWCLRVDTDTAGTDVEMEVPPFRYWAVAVLEYPLPSES